MPTAQTDVYALGAMSFELLTGRAPFETTDFIALLFKHASEPVPLLAEIRPGLPKGLQAVIEQAMAKDPRARYKSSRELARDLAAGEQSADELPTYVEPTPVVEPTVIEPTPEVEGVAAEYVEVERIAAAQAEAE